MIEAVKIWNEPNNKSHWDLELDPGWTRFAEMAVLAGKAIRSVHPTLTRVLGGISPIDPAFMNRMKTAGVLEHVDAVAVHGFPLDWNLWQIDDWPNKRGETGAFFPFGVGATGLGVSSLGEGGGRPGEKSPPALLWENRPPPFPWPPLNVLPIGGGPPPRH